MAKQAVKLSGQMAFEEAAQVLREVGQVDISSKSVWWLATRWGERLKGLEEVEQAQAHSVTLSEQALQRAGHSAGPMGAGMDGTMVHIREEGWKELKVGCLFEVGLSPTLDPQTKECLELGHAQNSTYVSHLGGPAAFGQKLWAEAQRRRWQWAADTQVIGDGAAWIWNLVGDFFYDAHQVVDWFHAKEHLAKAAHLAFGEGTPEARRWIIEQETPLFQGHADQIAQAILALAERKPTLRDGLLQEAGYFDKNQRRMQYLGMRAEGWVIGSGMIESGGKQYKERFTGPGMRWSRTGAERLLPVRTAIMSRRFDERWKAVYNSPPN